MGSCPVDPSFVFNSNYPFFTSTSAFMQRHFQVLAKEIKWDFMPLNGFIVEIGSNDGTFLSEFAIDTDFRHLGIEPSQNVAEKARDNGVLTLGKFFSDETAQEIISDMGSANVIVSANVFPHIVDRTSVLRGIKSLLKFDGVWIDEEVYFGDVIEKISYDQCYNEHVYFATITSYKELFELFDLEIMGVSFIGVHGGSVRFYVGHKGRATEEQREKINHFVSREGLSDLKRLETFQKEVIKSKHKFLSLLHHIKLNGEKIVGYGAPAKSSTILNYCGITTELIEKIYDTTPCKQGTLSPGMHIPIVPYEDFRKDNPRNVVLFIWNHFNEVKAKEKLKWGDRQWIMPI